MYTHRFRYSGLSPQRLVGILLAIFGLVITFRTHLSGAFLFIPAIILIASYGGAEFDDVQMRFRIFHHFLFFSTGHWKQYYKNSELRLSLGSIYHNAISGRRSFRRGYHEHFFEIWIHTEGLEPSLLFSFNEYLAARQFMQEKLGVLELATYDDYAASVAESRQRPRR